jgi:hypothetical protein
MALARVSQYQVPQPSKGYDYISERYRQIFESLTQGIQYVYNNAVEGDVAEFGTASGFTALTVACAMRGYGEMYANFLQQHKVGAKTLFLFDSFEGLPAPEHPTDLNSPNVQSGRWQQGTFKVLNSDELLEICSRVYDANKIKIVEGWYSKTLGGIAAGSKFAFLHLDCDLYSSTAEVLDHLFANEMISDGCRIYFDDWNCNRSSPRFGQRRAWQECVDKYKIGYSHGGDYAVVSHYLTVHMGS